MAKQQDAIAKLDAISTTLDKVSTESSAMVQEIADLKEAAQGEDVSDELMAKIDSVAAKANAIDALVADAPIGDGGGDETPTDDGGGVDETPVDESGDDAGEAL